MESFWRERYRPIIAEVLADHVGQPHGAVRAALREAFPDGSRSHHPYKIWLNEIRRQLGLTRDKRLKKGEVPPVASCEGQRALFANDDK